VVALLAVSLLGGFAVELWHRRAPALLDQLEAEPPRLAALTRISGPRPHAESARSRAGPRTRDGTPRRSSTTAGNTAAKAEPEGRPPASPPSAEHPLDLNGATAVELGELPGIGPSLASRILARREELGGRFASVEDLASVPGLGRRKTGLLRPLICVDSSPAPAPDPDATPNASGDAPDAESIPPDAAALAEPAAPDGPLGPP
jgi:competence ComEA-like helix-hairpin-helix protein